jgi:hypothetical protein
LFSVGAHDLPEKSCLVPDIWEKQGMLTPKQVKNIIPEKSRDFIGFIVNGLTLQFSAKI